jgi:hypothetical protein
MGKRMSCLLLVSSLDSGRKLEKQRAMAEVVARPVAAVNVLTR